MKNKAFWTEQSVNEKTVEETDKRMKRLRKRIFSDLIFEIVISDEENELFNMNTQQIY